ncbi:MAG: hypothetical protein KIT36_13740 [Alphaproteobacteria bacterium]|nr:hypothetical protein [Alphaproteobacteria bacterium]
MALLLIGATGVAHAQAQPVSGRPAWEPVWTPETVGKDNVPVPPQDRAFDPHAQTVPMRHIGVVTPPMRPAGTVPVASFPGSSVPVVSLNASALRPVPGGHWQVTLTGANNSPRVVDLRATCSFNNGARPVADVEVVMPGLRPGDQVAVDVAGPPVTSFVDTVPCQVISPLQ